MRKSQFLSQEKPPCSKAFESSRASSSTEHASLFLSQEKISARKSKNKNLKYKYTVHILMFRVVSCGGYIMLPFIFPFGFTLNTDTSSA